MEDLKKIKDNLICCVQSQMGDLSNVDAKELGEVMDMIKDLAETEYYCTITEAMKKGDSSEFESQRYYSGSNRMYPNYYQEPIMKYPDYLRNMDMGYGRMYYGGDNTGVMPSNTTYRNGGPNLGMRDSREGRSPMARRMYMETIQQHKDGEEQMKQLDNYIHELGNDITEMIHEATPEQKENLKQKISALAAKIV